MSSRPSDEEILKYEQQIMTEQQSGTFVISDVKSFDELKEEYKHSSLVCSRLTVPFLAYYSVGHTIKV